MPAARSTADLMREWMRVAGLTAAQAGARIGLTDRGVENIVQGRTRADDVLAQIALKKLIADAK